MRTYFIRHTKNLDINAATRDMLWNTRRIAIHYPGDKSNKLCERDNPSLSPSDYSGSALKAIRALVELAKNGGYVCAEYYPRTECFLGYVGPNTKIELVRGQWGTLEGHEGREAILKCLTLDKVKILSRGALALILVGRPRQGTIMRWRKAGKTIENIVEDRKIEPSLDLLFPVQQEVLCSEFLRLPAAKAAGLPSLIHLILPVGRTMRDIDIFGMSDSGKPIFAQVTHGTFEQSAKKIQALLKYGDGDRGELVLFCDCPGIKRERGMFIVPLQYVYDKFSEMETGLKWLQIAHAPNSQTSAA